MHIGFLSFKSLPFLSCEFAAHNGRSLDLIDQRFEGYDTRETPGLPAVLQAFIPADSESAAPRLNRNYQRKPGWRLCRGENIQCWNTDQREMACQGQSFYQGQSHPQACKRT